jgi:hypothetical protein
MTDQHRATPEQWEHVMFYAKGEEKFGTDSCILELRDRIAALEAAVGIGQPVTPPNTSALADSLVERVAKALLRSEDGGCWTDTDSAVNWKPEARAAIREVAAWLDTKGQHGCSLWMREEAER